MSRGVPVVVGEHLRFFVSGIDRASDVSSDQADIILMLREVKNDVRAGGWVATFTRIAAGAPPSEFGIRQGVEATSEHFRVLLLEVREQTWPVAYLRFSAPESVRIVRAHEVVGER